HDEPITWRDVEALPIIALGVLVVIGFVRIQQELTPGLAADFWKGAGIVILLGVRKMLGDRLDLDDAAA
ncbi:hypothetical protein CVH10_23985, partial [Halomonas sp. ND22Bw]